MTSDPPRVLGRYEVGARVGGGGMAHVYVGRGIADDGREQLVALKVIRDEYGHDPRFLRMFSDEAKILARLSHPNVIRTIESGITKDHRFIVMELLAGRTLAEVWELLAANREQLSLRLGAWICARVADGLHAAHELTDDAGIPMSVVHRDVNPWNIFLTHTGRVKLIDFGLAKARVRRTRSVDGVVKGKLPYLAPEQLSSRPVDRRIDIYALGTTLWEAGTMVRLFKRDSDIATFRAIVDGKVPDPRDLVAGYPDGLYAIVQRALRRDPDERYATARAMGDALDALVGDAGAELREELASLVSRLFPGEEEEHLLWRHEAISLRILATAPPPPLPVPIASSNLLGATPEITLDDSDIEVITPR
jgi:eukaryotic-like serine/threonine-protein kinase